MNNPPLRWWDLLNREARVLLCRRSMNNPPLRWWDLLNREARVALCRRSMNNPPTAALVDLDAQTLSSAYVSNQRFLDLRRLDSLRYILITAPTGVR